MRTGTLAATFVAAMASLVSHAMAQDSAGGSDPDGIVAVVNGEELTRSDLEASHAGLPEQYRHMPVDAIYDPLLDRLVDGELLLQAAETDSLAEDPEVAAAIARARADTLRQAYLSRAIEARATDEKLRAAYEQMRAQPGFSFEEVKARHILLENEDEAIEIIAQLADGGDFVELAKEHSTGPSGSRGGDLGYFRRDAMVTEFADAAFTMEPGSFSEEPVKTDFGWHVILVEDKRVVEPSFEETEPNLRNQLSNQLINEIVAELREGAEITRYNADGTERTAE